MSPAYISLKFLLTFRPKNFHSTLRLPAVLESSMWTSELQDLLYKDAQARPRSIYAHVVKPFLDNNGLIMSTLCEYGFQSKDDYEEHANLHSRGFIYFAQCCGKTFSSQTTMRDYCESECSGALPVSTLLHGRFDHMLQENETVTSQTASVARIIMKAAASESLYNCDHFCNPYFTFSVHNHSTKIYEMI